MKKLISIVIPAYNEEECVDILYERLSQLAIKLSVYDFEFIIVENGSVDSTFEKLTRLNAKDQRLKIVRLSRNCGSDNAIFYGLKYAKGDAAFITYADLEDPPEILGKFLEKWEGGYENIYGITRRRQTKFIRSLNSKLFYYLINKLTDGIIPKNVSDFRLVDRSLYKEIIQFSEKNKFMRGLFAWSQFKSIGIEYDRNLVRAGGKSKAHSLAVIKIALRAVCSFSTFPLRIPIFLGAIFFVLSLLDIMYSIFGYIFFDSPFTEFGIMIFAILMLFSMNFFILGVMGGYIGIIFEEAINRPVTIVKKSIGFDE